jgi:hypothetical protein
MGVVDLENPSRMALSSSGRRSQLFFRPGLDEFFSSREGSFHRWHVKPGARTSDGPSLQDVAATRDGFFSACLFSNQLVLTDSRGTRTTAPDDFQTPGEAKRTAQGRNGLSPDGRFLAVNPSFSPFLYIYRWPEVERVAKLTNQANIASFLFTPSGDELVACSRQMLEIWNTKTWRRTRELPGFRAAFFSPDQTTWWLAKDYSSAGLYDFRTMEPRLLLPTGMMPLAVSVDGSQLAVTVDNRRLQVWNLAAVRQELAALGLGP